MQLRTDAREIHGDGHSDAPPVADLRAEKRLRGFALEGPITLPTVILPSHVDAEIQKIAELLQRAAESDQSRGIRRFFRFLFSRQKSQNRILRQAVNVLVKTNTRLADRVNHLIDCIDCHTSMISIVAGARNADAQTIASLIELSRSFNTAVVSRLARAENQIGSLAGQLGDHQKELQETLASNERISTSVGTLAERITGIGQEVMQLHGRTQADTERFENRINVLAEQVLNCENNLRTSLACIQNADKEITLANEKVRNVALHLMELQTQIDRLQIHLTTAEAKMRSDAERLEDALRGKKI